MSPLVTGRLTDSTSAGAFADYFTALVPDYVFGCGDIAQVDAGLTDATTRFIFFLDAQAEVFLPKDFRTKEGDGSALPSEYKADAPSAELREAIRLLQAHSSKESRGCRDALSAILSRWHEKRFVGDIANEFWQMEEYDLWPQMEPNREAIAWLREHYREIGYSTKRSEGWERLQGGDVLIVQPGQVPLLRGTFIGWWIDDLSGTNSSHLPMLRRAHYLRDTAGGCNFAFDAFRRLPLTWYMPLGEEPLPDGRNRLNSHIVNIPEETSRTHYHPNPAVGGGKPQHEIYLVLAHSKLGLDSHGRHAQVHLYPHAPDYSHWVTIDLEPGMMCFIPPPIAHRGCNALVNVVTLPGFKPHNEIYIDDTIARAAPSAPVYNNSKSTGK